MVKMSMVPHFWTAAFILIGAFTGIQTATLRFYHGSLQNYTETPLEDPLRIQNLFNNTLTSMFYIFGFSENPDSLGATLVLSAYMRTQYANVILLDWSKEARIDGRGTILSYVFSAAPNAKLVGRRLGRALVTLTQQGGINANKIHLVGHSLGAHVAGNAGEFVQGYDIKLGRITGCDPAGPMFEGTVNLGGLDSSDAQFVVALHTDPNLYGVRNPIGSVDFWANCNNRVQPGCSNIQTIFDADSNDSFCSHQRSPSIFAEAIARPTAVPAAKADSCNTWTRQTGTAVILYLGDFIDTRARGNYFFSTNSREPFSKGQAGLLPNN